MRYSQVKQSIVTQFRQERSDANSTVFFILGQPGGGKSACAREAVHELGFENVVEFTASLRDPVDVLGTPDNTGDYTRWVPPQEFWQLRKGVGRCALILEELSDAPVAMQNALCGVIYDRRAGQLELSDQLYIIATGNRTEDKSGANRITSKLAGRTRRLDFTENLDDLIDYAVKHDWPTEMVQFFRFRPGMIADFDPNRFANPTPRTWEDVARMPKNFPDEIEMLNIAGSVGDGAATEYLGFKRIYMGLPDLDNLIKHPKTADVPSDIAIRYAITGALAEKVTKQNFKAVMEYMGRLPVEFEVMAMQDVTRRNSWATGTEEFATWAVKVKDLISSV